MHSPGKEPVHSDGVPSALTESEPVQRPTHIDGVTAANECIEWPTYASHASALPAQRSKLYSRPKEFERFFGNSTAASQTKPARKPAGKRAPRLPWYNQWTRAGVLVFGVLACISIALCWMLRTVWRECTVEEDE
jgi:hypothetical protein